MVGDKASLIPLTTSVTQMLYDISGSCNMECNCTATMTVTILKDKSVGIDAGLTHYGHRKGSSTSESPKRTCQEFVKLTRSWMK